ncbi:MAG: hypothetical protein ABSF55_00245 [Candidatus Staskawiczbacteria bacterium]|jgi:hypothetical protein
MEIREGTLVALQRLNQWVLGVVINKRSSVRLIYPKHLYNTETSALAEDLTPLAQTLGRESVSTEISNCLPEVILSLVARQDELDRRLNAMTAPVM